MRVDLVLRGRPVVVLDRELGSDLGELAHEGDDAHDLARELAGRVNADGLGRLEVRIDAAQHGEDERSGLPRARLRLPDEVCWSVCIIHRVRKCSRLESS